MTPNRGSMFRASTSIIQVTHTHTHTNTGRPHLYIVICACKAQNIHSCILKNDIDGGGKSSSGKHVVSCVCFFLLFFLHSIFSHICFARLLKVPVAQSPGQFSSCHVIILRARNASFFFSALRDGSCRCAFFFSKRRCGEESLKRASIGLCLGKQLFRPELQSRERGKVPGTIKEGLNIYKGAVYRLAFTADKTMYVLFSFGVLLNKISCLLRSSRLMSKKWKTSGA